MPKAIYGDRESLVEPFSFQHACELDETIYLSLNPGVKHTRRTRLGLVSTGLFGILLLFWPYSFGFGVCILLLTILFWRLPLLGERAMREQFYKHHHLRGSLTFGVSHRGMWLRGSNYASEADWDALGTCEERQGWLKLSPWGTMPVYLPVQELRAADVYDTVLKLAHRHQRPSSEKRAGR
jgi:hypothetical protein